MGLSPAERGLRPSETLRAVKNRLKPRAAPRPAPVAPMPEPEPEAVPEAALDVWVSLVRHWSASPDLSMDTARLLLPENYWPHLDEADWPDLESVERLQGLFDERIEEQIRMGGGLFSQPGPEFEAAVAKADALLEQAEEEGLLADEPVWDREPLDDPWALLHQAQLHRAAELFGLMDDARVRVGQQEGSLAETAWIADRLATLYPDHPAADYARLMSIEASMQDLWGDAAEPQRAVDEVVAAVLETNDPLVKEAALVGFLNGDAEKLEGTDTRGLLQVLAAEVDTLPRDLAEAVAAQALELAMRNDPTQVDPWLERVERAASDAEDAVIDATDLDDAYDDLARRGLKPAQTWRAELHSRVAKCRDTMDGLPAGALLEAAAQWDEAGWSFSAVDAFVYDGTLGTDLKLFRKPIEPPPELLACLDPGPWSFLPPGDRLTLRIDPN